MIVPSPQWVVRQLGTGLCFRFVLVVRLFRSHHSSRLRSRHPRSQPSGHWYHAHCLRFPALRFCFSACVRSSLARSRLFVPHFYSSLSIPRPNLRLRYLFSFVPHSPFACGSILSTILHYRSPISISSDTLPPILLSLHLHPPSFIF